MWLKVVLLPSFFGLIFLQAALIEAWSGHVCSTRRIDYRDERFCVKWCWWWGRCDVYSYRQYIREYYEQDCCLGWRHNGDNNCIIPICNSPCQNGGTCVGPEECHCPSTHTGQFTQCTTPQCSYSLPCYPGICSYPNRCNCNTGFQGSGQVVCLTMSKDEGMPKIGISTCTLSHVRRTDNTTRFAYAMDGTSKEKDTFWSNQKDFNYLKFEFQSIYMSPQLSPQPPYVKDAAFGIVGGHILVNISKIPRSGGSVRDMVPVKQYDCPGLSDTSPKSGIANCNIVDDQFYTNIEHGDWLDVMFTAKSGGYRQLVDPDYPGKVVYPNLQTYLGQTDRKEVEFKFDFNAPTHCSEPNSTARCESTKVPLIIAKEFTKLPINISWAGWGDDLSGMDRYHLEVFALFPDPFGSLEENTPLAPVFSADFNHTHNNVYRFTYIPVQSGMFSILLQAVDKANNSKIARRLVLYDPFSNISLNEEKGSRLFVSSAVPETGYMWQTTKEGKKTEINVEWNHHFVNKFISDGKLLNKVKTYPIQFQEIESDGILHSSKFVYPGLDDNEGQRTVSEKPNKNGIVRFEAVTSLEDGIDEPTLGWFNISGLAEQFTFNATLNDGRTARIWVRAHDVLGNIRTDKTEVHFDSSVPNVDTSSISFVRNQNNGTYIYTSRILFKASDPHSGVHKIGFRLIRDDTGDEQYNGSCAASQKNISCSIMECNCFLEKCFNWKQILDLDNCWFMTAEEKLDHVNITIEVTVYNQAMLEKTFNVTVEKLNDLHGLEHYSGPTNIRVAKSNANGVRLEWDLPKTESCYGRTDIVIILNMQDGSPKVYTVSRNTTFVDIIGLDPEKDYSAAFSLGYEGQRMGHMPFSFHTAAKEDSIPTAAIIGGVLAAVAIIGLLIAIFIVLLRRGRLEPVRKHLSRFTVRYRNTIKARDNQTYAKSMGDDLYIYGGMRFDERQQWHMNRDDVVFESLLKNGRFANIYKASLRFSSKKRQTVVAKSLKEGFTDKDKELMMAKINFTGTQVGNHPNVLKFIGAVIDDEAMGPFIIYEYCENGPLKDYLESQRKYVTLQLQETLFRFGLDICKGMEYLVSKKIVHRRLAARNILLTLLNEVKIAGFGPQNFELDDNDGDTEKKERIPIKWMAPECMKSTAGATEKSDVWSYGVVLWEVFSLGETPYQNIRSRDLPARLKKGERPSKPELCDDTWYAVMQRAWSIAPEKRPTFAEIRGELDQLFVQSAGDDYYYYKR